MTAEQGCGLIESMNRTQGSVRVVRGGDADFSAEARAIQRKAAGGLGSVVRFGPIVFFSTETGDAWMLDAEDGQAACLARDFEPGIRPSKSSA